MVQGLGVHGSSGLWWSVGDEVTGYSNLYKKITYMGITVKKDHTGSQYGCMPPESEVEFGI